MPEMPHRPGTADLKRALGFDNATNLNPPKLKSGTLHRAYLRDLYNDRYSSFKCWRKPKPRQVWIKVRDAQGNVVRLENSAPHHRPATNHDTLLDLTIVIILAAIGQQFRSTLLRIPAESRFDWDFVWNAVTWNDSGSGAFQGFSNAYLILVMRWVRYCKFVNIMDQRDLLFELFWVAHISLFAIAGTAVVLGEFAPCNWNRSLFVEAVLGLDCLVIFMYLYNFICYGVMQVRRFSSSVLSFFTLPIHAC